MEEMCEAKTASDVTSWTVDMTVERILCNAPQSEGLSDGGAVWVME